MRSSQLALAAVALAAAGVTSFSSQATAAVIYGVTNTNNLVQFNSATPGTIDSSLFITGLSGESVLGIDFRPATGELFALTNGNKLYTLNTTTGAATPVGSGLGGVLNGTAFGFDFNPTIDRIRVVSESDRNYVLNPNNGLLQATATNLAYGVGDPNAGVNPNVTASAYNAAGLLYGIDTGIDILLNQGNNTGVLTTVGPLLTANVNAVTGFDIDTTGTAYAALMSAGGSVSNLYTINLGSGTAILVGQINGGLNIVDISVVIPEPSTLAGVAAAGLLARRRRVASK